MAEKQKDGKALNQEAEDAIVAAQWERAKADGVLDNPILKDSLNANRSKQPKGK